MIYLSITVSMLFQLWHSIFRWFRWWKCWSSSERCKYWIC